MRRERAIAAASAKRSCDERSNRERFYRSRRHGAGASERRTPVSRGLASWSRSARTMTCNGSRSPYSAKHEHLAGSLKKGDRIYVEGRLKLRPWKDAESALGLRGGMEGRELGAIGRKKPARARDAGEAEEQVSPSPQRPNGRRPTVIGSDHLNPMTKSPFRECATGEHDNASRNLCADQEAGETTFIATAFELPVPPSANASGSMHQAAAAGRHVSIVA